MIKTELSLPLKLRCGVETKNRIVLAPLTNGQSPTTKLSEDEFRWLAARIRGGFGIVTSCATHVTPTAQAWPGELGIFSDEHKAGWRRLAEEGRGNNALVIPQLFHGGVRCPSQVTGVQPVSSSVFKLDTPDFEAPRSLEENEILQLQQDFVSAAIRAIDCGLPGVEIHGANGYLFTQFLSPATNKRTDGWGGTPGKRARFLLETTKLVRTSIGASKVLGVRLSPEGTQLIPDIDIDEMIDVAVELSLLGVDYISLSLWDAFKVATKYADSKKTIVERYREKIPSQTRLSASGKIWTREEAERLNSTGADLVVLGTAGIANPSWPFYFTEPNFEPTRFPVSPKKLEELAVSPLFAKYLGGRFALTK